MSPLIVGIGGTVRPGSSSEQVLKWALDEARALGARTRMFGGSAVNLPTYSPYSPQRTPDTMELISALKEADGIILSSPGYHGSISGMLKNALDYVEDLREWDRPYFEGRSVGCIVCSGGWQAAGSTLAAMRSIVHALRGWPTPLGVAINTSEAAVIGRSGECVDDEVAKKVRSLAGEVVEFARMMSG
jgi:FMN reductase